MARKSTKTSDGDEIIEEISGIGKSFTSLIVKTINNDKKKNIDRIVNNDPRRKKKSNNPRKDVMNDLNLC